MKINVTEKELLKSGAADSSSSVKHRKAIIALLVIVAVLIAALAGAWAMFGTQLTAAMTIEKLDDHLWSIFDTIGQNPLLGASDFTGRGNVGVSARSDSGSSVV